MAIISISDSQVNGADQILVADSSSKIPATDGSQITILNATNVSSGTIASARLDTGTTANKLVLLDGSGNLPAVDASLLTGIVSATISASDPTVSTNPSGGVGTEWNNSTSGAMYICTDATAGENVWTNVGAGSGDVEPIAWTGSRGLIVGGYTNTDVNNIDYITIATTGNATDFGDLTVARQNPACCSNGARGVAGSGLSSHDVIDYVTVASPGNAIDFGNLTVARGSHPASFSDGTKGCFAGGYDGSNKRDVIDYITIATPGNATDFGNLTGARFGPGGYSNGPRGVISGGRNVGNNEVNIIEYVTIASPGNATDFGDLTTARRHSASFASLTRGIIAGGNNSSDVIDYTTIATTGNATDFGNCLQTLSDAPAGSSNLTRGIIAGGAYSVSGAALNVIQYITIATTGNSTDFGDLTVATMSVGGLSGA